MPDFTPEQRDAVQYRDQDACVVAGPGSGKTTVLVERYRSLIEDRNFAFSDILAITFTEKAAANMKAKLAEQFRYNPVLLREFDTAWVSTIHGFCARLLKENAIAAGIDPRFRVLDARESDDLQFECISEALDELTAQRREAALALIEALHVPRIATDLKAVYDGIRSAGLTVSQVRQMPSPGGSVEAPAVLAARIVENVRSWPFKLSPTQIEHRPEILEYAAKLARLEELPFAEVQQLLNKPDINLGRIPREFKDELKEIREEHLKKRLLTDAVDRHVAQFRHLIFDVLKRFEALYTERKLALGALDFNDLERRSIQLLRENEEVKSNIQNRFRQIMLDEFQDVNEQQNHLVNLIRGEEVFFAVGDSNQSIYGFRHARPEIFRAYRDEIVDLNKHAGSLFSNFRSRAEILRFVERMLNSAAGIDTRELVAARTFLEKAQPSIEIVRVRDDQEEGDEEGDADSTREARWIAYRIAQLRGALEIGEPGKTRRADYRDFAVLCRNGESMKPILLEFSRAGIPYVCGRRQSFLVSREGLDIAALLHTIANARDGVALATVLRSRLVGVSDEALLRARMLSGSLTSGLNTLAFDPGGLAAFDPEDAAKLQRFLRDLKRWRADLQIVPLDVLIVRMLTDCGFVWTPGTVQGDNIEAFLQLARSRGAGRTLLEFLYELESIERGLSTEAELSDEDQGNCVQVMTAHAAKGLEFPVTIVASLHQGTRRGSASVSFTPEHGLGMKWRDSSKKRPTTHDSLKDSWALANAELVRAREDEEANRLLYVALTRAEEHLILTYTMSDRSPANWAKMAESFIESHGGADVSVILAETDPPAPEASAGSASDLQIEAIPRPEPGRTDESAVNVTSLAVFADCPRKYFLQRYIGWSGRPSNRHDEFEQNEADADDPELSAADLGSAVHAILAEKPGLYPAEAHQLAQVFLQNELGRRAAASPRTAREWEFIVNLENTILRGSIDLWFEEAGQIHIVDYKTNLMVRPEEYAPQLALYALAIEAAFGRRPAAGWLHYLRHDRLEQVPLDEAALEAARELIRSLRASQERLEFDLNEGPHCRSCEFYRRHCPAGS